MRKYPMCGLAILLATSVAVAQPAEPKLPEGLRDVPPDAVYFMHIRAGDFLKSPVGKTLLQELHQDREAKKGIQKIEEELGVKAADLESVTLLIPSFSMRGFNGPRFGVQPRDMIPERGMPKPVPKVEEKKAEESAVLYQPIRGQMLPYIDQQDMFYERSGPPVPLVIVTSTKPLDRKKILRSHLFDPKQHEMANSPTERSVLFLSDRSVMIGMPGDLARYSEMMSRKQYEIKNRPLESALALGAEPHLLVAGGHVPAELRRLLIQPFSPEARLLAVLSPLLQCEAGMTLDLGANIDLRLQFQAQSEVSAGHALQAVKSLRVIAEMGLDKLREGGESGGWKLELEKGAAKALADAVIEQKGTLVRAQLKMDVSPNVAKRFTKEIVAMLRHKGDRTVTANNLKQIGLALHIHHDAFKRLPAAAICDKAGKPLLSWRVAILPFIEQQPLYQQFDLNQPWDHPTNKKLIARMPAIYAMPEVDPSTGKTNFRVLVGPNTMFPERMGIQLQDAFDGTSNTFMVVEAKEPTIWTRPDDIPFDAKSPMPKFGVSSDGFHVVMADGSVRFVRSTVPQDVIRTYIIRNSGEARRPLD